MRCFECKNRVPRQAKFCPSCGAELAGVLGGGAGAAGSADMKSRAPADDGPESESLEPLASLQGRSAFAEADEGVIWEGSFSALGLIHSWLLAVLITVVLVVGAAVIQADAAQWTVVAGILGVVWIGLLLLLAFHKLDVRYVLTNRRLIHRTGILLQRTDRLELIDMNDVSHEQSIIERFFNVGTIEVTTSDRSHPIIALPGISNVSAVAMLIDDARLRERNRRGIHVEQI